MNLILEQQRRVQLGAGLKYPKNWLQDPGVFLDSFSDNANSWSVNRGTLENNLTEHRDGSQSIKFISPVGVSAYGHKTIASINFGGITPTAFRVSFYIHDSLSKFSRIDLVLSSNSALASTASCKIQNSIALHNGWNTVDVPSSGWTLAGGESWANDMIRMRIAVVPIAGEIINVSIDSIRVKYKVYPAVMFTFDDYQSSVYTQAFAYLKLKNKKGAFFVYTPNIGEVGAVTASQLIEMESNGWVIGNHTDSPNTLVGMSQAADEAAFNNAKNTLLSLPVTKSVNFVAYPSGGYDATVRSAMINVNMNFGRISGNTGFAKGHKDNNYMVPTIGSLGNNYTLASAKLAIDDIKTNGGVGLFYNHGLVSNTPSIIEWTISDFNELVDYCIANNVAIITPFDYLSAQL